MTWPVTFAAPWALVGLVLVPGLAAAYGMVRARRSARRAELAALGFAPVGPDAATGPEPSIRRRWRGRLVPTALALTLLLLILAAARPQATVPDLRREGTVILAVDTSSSMTATDVAPTRMVAAREAAKAFVARQPPTIRIGVVSFGDNGVVLQAPTAVQADVLTAIDRLTPQGGTSLGQGIFASLKAIAGGKLAITEEQLKGNIEDLDIGYYGSSAIVLLSDGQDTSRLDPLPLVQLAAGAGVKIHTVGLGDPAGTTVTVDGFTAATRLDEAMLTAVADATGGRYLAAPNEQALTDVYGSIDLAVTSTPVHTEISALFAAAALLVLVAAAAASILRTGRVI